MSKTFMTPMSTVMKTVITVGQICGTTTRKKVWRSLAPSIRAASRVSVGTPLTAAESSTMENPTCAQIEDDHQQEAVEVEALLLQPDHRVEAERGDDRVLQADLGLARGPGLVDEPPDRAGADHADRHRQEDDRLGELLAARLQPVGQHGDAQPERHRDGRHDDDPQQRVEQRLLEVRADSAARCSSSRPTHAVESRLAKL